MTRFFLHRGSRPSPAKGNAVYVTADHEGILLKSVGAASKHLIRWQDIVRITAFKRDLYAYDLICLLIQSKTGIWELDEEMSGWQETVQTIDTFLASATPYTQWFSNIIAPAFETTPIDVYNSIDTNASD